MSKSKQQSAETQLYIGFAGAAVLTIIAYLSVSQHWFSAWATAAFVLLLAIVQFLVQTYYFLHLRGEAKPRWRSWTFVYAIIMMLIVVVGSLWVMYNLNYRMGMSGREMEKELLHQNTKGF